MIWADRGLGQLQLFGTWQFRLGRGQLLPELRLLQLQRRAALLGLAQLQRGDALLSLLILGENGKKGWETMGNHGKPWETMGNMAFLGKKNGSHFFWHGKI